MYKYTWDSGEDNGSPLQYSCLENPMGGEAWWTAVHRVVKSRTRLSNFTFTFHFHALEKEMATPSSVLAWGIPEAEEPSGLPSMRSHRVGHYWSDLAAAAVYICRCYSFNSSHPPFHPYVHYPFSTSERMYILYIPALQIGSSVPFFSRFIYMH